MTYSAYLPTFVNNCMFMKKKNGYTPYDLDFSYLFDLDPEALAEMMDIAPHFTGVGSWCEEVVPNKPSHQNGRLTEHKFDESNFAGVTDINKCSTSWATQAIKIAENIVGNEVKFSVKYLFKCMPLSYDLAATMDSGCKGFNS